MTYRFTRSICLCLLLTAFMGGAAIGGDNAFIVSTPGGPIPDEGIGVFPVVISPRVTIESMEVVIEDLSHEYPSDLDFFLIAPYGDFIELMTDRGGGTEISNEDLLFLDSATGAPGVPITSGRYVPEGLLNSSDAGFGKFVGRSTGAGAWILLAIDDAAADSGSIGSFTLRGRIGDPGMQFESLVTDGRGACCFPNAICFESVEKSDCSRAGGSFLGIDQTCTDDPDDDGAIGCGDGCPTDPMKTAPGLCGCFVPDVDTDADGVGDCIDRCPETPPLTPVDMTGCTALEACCFRAGVCFDQAREDNCLAVGGVYQGHRAECERGCVRPDDGDVDGDGDTDRCDHNLTVSCLSGPDPPFDPGYCRRADFNDDGDIDLDDVSRLVKAFVLGSPCPIQSPTPIRTKSSGATKPGGDPVTLSLDEPLSPACEAAAVWTQTGGPLVGTIALIGGGSASYTPPDTGTVFSTTTLTFTVNISGFCPSGPRTGSVSVPLQVADLTFDLPPTIALNAPILLNDFTKVTGAPVNFLTLYFSEELTPDGIELDINQFNSTLTVTNGVGSRVRITVQVFAAAGLLAEASDEIQIVASVRP